MEKDKRPFYTWIAVLLGNIYTILVLILLVSSGSITSSSPTVLTSSETVRSDLTTVTGSGSIPTDSAISPNNSSSIHFNIDSLFQLQNFIILCISLFVSIVPILLSKSNSKWRKYFGYGLPILLLLSFLYHVYDYFTCTGKFCGVASFLFLCTFGFFSIIFAIFYAIGVYAKKWDVRFILSVIWVEVILMIGSAVFFLLF